MYTRKLEVEQTMIVVDSREKDDVLRKGLTGCTVMTLHSGDVYFVGKGPDGLLRIGIERKRIQNLLASILNKQLFEQLRNMEQDYDIRYLIVEGIIKNSIEGFIHHYTFGRWEPVLIAGHMFKYDFYVKTIAELSAILGVTTITTGSGAETVAVCRALYDWWNTVDFSKHKLHQAQRVKPTQIPNDLFTALPSVGQVLGGALRARFKTIANLVNASLEEIKSVEGIGDKRARDIWAALHGKPESGHVEGSKAQEVAKATSQEKGDAQNAGQA